MNRQRARDRQALVQANQTTDESIAQALLWAGAIAAYGNVLNTIVWQISSRGRHLAGIVGTLGLLATVLTWHRHVDRRTMADLGLHTQAAGRELAWGTGAGVALAIPPVIAYLIQHGRGKPVEVEEISTLGRPALLGRLLVTTPLLVAFVEEVAFRGFVQGKLKRAMPKRPHRAVLLSSTAFMLWHIIVNLRTLKLSNVEHVGIVSRPVALAGGLLGVFTAGLLFGGLYHRSKSLVAPIMAHWLVDAVLLLALAFPPNVIIRWARTARAMQLHRPG